MHTINLHESERVELKCPLPINQEADSFSAEWVVNGFLLSDLNNLINKMHTKLELLNQNKTLLIKDLKQTDSGSYECNVQTGTDKNYRKKYKLNVEKKKLNVDTKHKHVKLVKGEPVILDCAWWLNEVNFDLPQSKRVTIEWKLNGSLLNQDLTRRKFEFLDNFNALLKINDVSIDETYNSYSCLLKQVDKQPKMSTFSLYVGGNSLQLVCVSFC
jgi:hypothetical protein